MTEDQQFYREAADGHRRGEPEPMTLTVAYWAALAALAGLMLWWSLAR